MTARQRVREKDRTVERNSRRDMRFDHREKTHSEWRFFFFFFSTEYVFSFG